ncbi:MAG: YfbM family protein [Aureispira sp.]
MILSLMRVPASNLKNYLEDSAELEKDLYANHEATSPIKLIDLDKSWDGIFYLLNGEGIAGAGEGVSRLLLSGELVDEEQDLGYGPAHYVTPEEVKKYYSELASWTEEDMAERFDSEDMQAKDLYPNTAWDEQDLEYVSLNFGLLQQFYKAAEAEGQAVITMIS